MGKAEEWAHDDISRQEMQAKSIWKCQDDEEFLKIGHRMEENGTFTYDWPEFKMTQSHWKAIW